MKKKNMMAKFKVMFNNIRGYKSKKDTLAQLIFEHKPAVVGIAETNLDKDEKIDEIDGYLIRRKDRPTPGGGVMLIYRKELEHMVMEEEDTCDGECLWLTMRNQNIRMKIGVVYMPQESRTKKELKHLYTEIGKQIENATMNNAHVILMGDFNAKLADEGEEIKTSKAGKMMEELANEQDMYFANNDDKCEGKWTRIMGEERSVLDYILVKSDDREYIGKMTIDESKEKTPYWGVTTDNGTKVVYSDHCMMELVMNWRIMLVEEAGKKKFMGRKEYGEFARALDERKVSDILKKGDFQQDYTEWSDTVLKIADESSRKPRKRQTWKVNRQLRRAKKLVGEMMNSEGVSKGVRNVWKMQKTLIDEHIWMEITIRKKNLIDKTVDTLKQRGGVHSSDFWDIRKKILGRKTMGKHAIKDQDGVIQTEDEEIKRVYADYFSKLLAEEECKGINSREIEDNVRRMIRGIEVLAQVTKEAPCDREVTKEVISKLKMKKSGDRDGWRNEMISMGGEEMERSINIIMSRISKTLQVPEEFNLMTILAIHKKYSKLLMENKRGLFLTNIISKVVERITKKRNSSDMKKNSCEMQNGGKEGRSPIDNLFMGWSIIERRKYMMQDTYMVFIDMQKCFDKLWLDDGIVEMWKGGTVARDAIVLKRMNERSVVTVRTPVGEATPIELKNIVRQGTVSGPDICCSSTSAVNRIGRKLITFYGPDIEIGAPVFVDDINIASDIATANDLVYNCSLLEERKKMTVNTEPDKSAYLTIKSSDEPEEELSERVKNGWIKRVKEYKLLGTWMNEDGNFSTAVQKMKKKLPLMALTSRQIGNPHVIGRYAMMARMKLIDSVGMPGLLYGAEAVPNLEKEMPELEKIQHKLLCDSLGLPISTPYMPLLMELGCWTMKYKISYKKMMLYHNIIHSSKDRTIRKMVIYQEEEGREGTWASGVIRSIEDVGIEVKPEDVLKSKWKKEVKEKIELANQEQVRNECERMRKGRTVSKGNWGKKEYMNLEMEEAREIMKMRLHMTPLPCNYGHSNDGCSLCHERGKIDTEHYLQCPGTEYLRKKWEIGDESVLETDDCKELTKIRKYLKQVCTLMGTGKQQ